MRAHARMLEFRIGDRVVFHPEGHLPVVGILIRYNKKTVTVIADSGQHWNVSPGLLRKESPEKASPGDSNVVPLRKNRRRSLARARTLPGRMP
jgi:hypothetical protein